MRLSRIHDERAQGLIEFALIASVLMLFFLGTVDFSRFMYYADGIRSAARVGAEQATNPCLNVTVCGRTQPPTADEYLTQAAVCEPYPDISLRPHPADGLFTSPTYPSGTTFCNACLSQAQACPTVNNPCPGTSCSAASWSGSSCGTSTDVCIKRTNSAGAVQTTPASGQTVTIWVGYNFVPFTPLIKQFFPTTACWTGDTTTHTICAKSVGHVI